MSISDLPEECLECEDLAKQVRELQEALTHQGMEDGIYVGTRNDWVDRAMAAEAKLAECQKQLDAATALALRLMEKPIWVIPEMEK